MPFRFSPPCSPSRRVALLFLVALALSGCGAGTSSVEHRPVDPSSPSEVEAPRESTEVDLLEATTRPPVTLRVQSGTVSSPLRSFLEEAPDRLTPCFAERLRRQGFLLGRFAIVVDAEGRFADSVNRMGRSYLRLELSRAERQCVAEGLAELALPAAPESWPAIVEFDDPAVVRSDGQRESLAYARQQHCEGLNPLSDVDCAARHVVYEPEVRVRVSDCSVETCQPIVAALDSRLPMFSHCIWFTHNEPQLGHNIALSLVFDDDGSLLRATHRPAGSSSISSAPADTGIARCVVAALDGLRSPGPLETSVTFGSGPDGAGAGALVGPR